MNRSSLHANHFCPHALHSFDYFARKSVPFGVQNTRTEDMKTLKAIACECWWKKFRSRGSGGRWIDGGGGKTGGCGGGGGGGGSGVVVVVVVVVVEVRRCGKKCRSWLAQGSASASTSATPTTAAASARATPAISRTKSDCMAVEIRRNRRIRIRKIYWMPFSSIATASYIGGAAICWITRKKSTSSPLCLLKPKAPSDVILEKSQDPCLRPTNTTVVKARSLISCQGIGSSFRVLWMNNLISSLSSSLSSYWDWTIRFYCSFDLEQGRLLTWTLWLFDSYQIDSFMVSNVTCMKFRRYKHPNM